MDYPEWAPSRLVEFHKRSLSKQSAGEGYDMEEELARLEKADGQPLTENEIDNMRVLAYRFNQYITSGGCLCSRERNELLGRCLTDRRMKSAWRSIERHIHDDKDILDVWALCENAIVGWRADAKHSYAERRRVFEEIHEHARALFSLMSETTEFRWCPSPWCMSRASSAAGTRLS